MDLYDKLHDVYFGLDDIEIGGVKGKKLEMLETLPPLLHIQLQVSVSLQLGDDRCLIPYIPASECNSTSKPRGMPAFVRCSPNSSLTALVH